MWMSTSVFSQVSTLALLIACCAAVNTQTSETRGHVKDISGTAAEGRALSPQVRRETFPGAVQVTRGAALLQGAKQQKSISSASSGKSRLGDVDDDDDDLSSEDSESTAAAVLAGPPPPVEDRMQVIKELAPSQERDSPAFAAVAFLFAGVGGFFLFYLVQQTLQQKQADKLTEAVHNHMATMRFAANKEMPPAPLDEQVPQWTGATRASWAPCAPAAPSNAVPSGQRQSPFRIPITDTEQGDTEESDGTASPVVDSSMPGPDMGTSARQPPARSASDRNDIPTPAPLRPLASTAGQQLPPVAAFEPLPEVAVGAETEVPADLGLDFLPTSPEDEQLLPTPGLDPDQTPELVCVESNETQSPAAAPALAESAPQWLKDVHAAWRSQQGTDGNVVDKEEIVNSGALENKHMASLPASMKTKDEKPFVSTCGDFRHNETDVGEQAVLALPTDTSDANDALQAEDALESEDEDAPETSAPVEHVDVVNVDIAPSTAEAKLDIIQKSELQLSGSSMTSYDNIAGGPSSQPAGKAAGKASGKASGKAPGRDAGKGVPLASAGKAAGKGQPLDFNQQGSAKSSGKGKRVKGQAPNLEDKHASVFARWMDIATLGLSGSLTLRSSDSTSSLSSVDSSTVPKGFGKGKGKQNGSGSGRMGKGVGKDAGSTPGDSARTGFGFAREASVKAAGNMGAGLGFGRQPEDKAGHISDTDCIDTSGAGLGFGKSPSNNAGSSKCADEHLPSKNAVDTDRQPAVADQQLSPPLESQDGPGEVSELPDTEGSVDMTGLKVQELLSLIQAATQIQSAWRRWNACRKGLQDE